MFNVGRLPKHKECAQAWKVSYTLFCRLIDKTCGQGTSWALPTEGLLRLHRCRSDLYGTGSEEDKSTVSEFRGCSTESLSVLLALHGITTTNGSYSFPTLGFPILKGKVRRMEAIFM